MSEFQFYLDVLKALDTVGAKYMVVGAYGASAYGLSRNTHDVDIIVDLDSAACDALALQFPPPRYYADPVQMRDSIWHGIMFNIIDGSQGVKADLVPLSREPEYQIAFNQRIRRRVYDGDGNPLDIWCARPEDIIVGKLMAWQEGRSAKHPSDIYAVLNFVLSGLADMEFDVNYVSQRVTSIGADALRLWVTILDRVQSELDESPPPF
ncbi:MAG: hypothetical protein KDI07_14560 [Anaerolineae bacterium]|nr:hypothetical protein [Anaerolineae bacterium]MCB0249793.1 hypothetical protein [Anaerolineae bacterium]MCB9132537.1 hypothetical protein [Anaerolineales bacterium]MCB9141650.1 hypothetical protein [Anaerolineales bacterium]HRX03014.1 hypothetical protein [Anaerolineae bacterium]